MKMFLIFITLIFLVGCGEQYLYEVPIEVHIENKTGLAVDRDRLYFGTINPVRSSSSTRTVNVTNHADVTNVFVFEISGQVKEWASVNPEKVSLQPGESIGVEVSLFPTNDVVYGKYSGKLEARYS